jgi:hypothetical protein
VQKEIFKRAQQAASLEGISDAENWLNHKETLSNHQ